MADTTNPEVAARVQASFDRQAFMRTVGARLVSVGPGQVVIEWPFSSHLTQQHGFAARDGANRTPFDCARVERVSEALTIRPHRAG
jgi:hypothetical protein